jgi:hypothetical protein
VITVGAQERWRVMLCCIVAARAPQLDNFLEQDQAHRFLLEGSAEDDNAYVRSMAELVLFALAPADMFRCGARGFVCWRAICIRGLI